VELAPRPGVQASCSHLFAPVRTRLPVPKKASKAPKKPRPGLIKVPLKEGTQAEQAQRCLIRLKSNVTLYLTTKHLKGGVFNHAEPPSGIRGIRAECVFLLTSGANRPIHTDSGSLKLATLNIASIAAGTVAGTRCASNARSSLGRGGKGKPINWQAQIWRKTYQAYRAHFTAVPARMNCANCRAQTPALALKRHLELSSLNSNFDAL